MVKRLFCAFIALLVLNSAVWAQSGYGIRPGDQLSIEVLEDPSLNRQVLVLPDGSVSIPLAGSINARGRTTEEVRTAIANALAPNFASTPSVFVSVAALAQREAPTAVGPAAAETIDVYVMGEVGAPGKAMVEPGTTLLQLLSQVGGFSKFAAKNRIQLRRIGKDGREAVYQFNYRAIEAGSSQGGRTTLADGDVIVVPQRKLFE